MTHGEAFAAVVKSGGVWSGVSQPELQPGLDIWYDDFFELSTDRQLGMAAGPLPHGTIARYVEGMDPDDAEMCRACFRAMDELYRSGVKQVADQDPLAAFNSWFG